MRFRGQLLFARVRPGFASRNAKKTVTPGRARTSLSLLECRDPRALLELRIGPRGQTGFAAQGRFPEARRQVVARF